MNTWLDLELQEEKWICQLTLHWFTGGRDRVRVVEIIKKRRVMERDVGRMREREIVDFL